MPMIEHQPADSNSCPACRYCGATANLVHVTSVYEGDYWSCRPGEHQPADKLAERITDYCRNPHVPAGMRDDAAQAYAHLMATLADLAFLVDVGTVLADPALTGRGKLAALGISR